MISRSKNPAYRRWLSLFVALVVILAMSPAALAATVPGSPTGLAATPGNGQVALTWAAPASDGGSPLTDYRIQYKKSTALTWTTFPDGASLNLFAMVTSLANGTSYDFRVRAGNAMGWSTPSNVVTATPTAANPGAPGIPSNLTATPGDKKVVLTWDAPADNGSPITDYGVQQRTIGGTWATYPDGTSTATTATVTLLVNLTTYEFRMRARNAVGWGTWSSPITATPAAAAVVPGAPQNLAGVRGDQKVSLTWAAPASDGGSPITDYRVYYKKSTASTWTTYPDGVSTNLFATVPLLLNGTSYDFRVRAINAIGMSAPSATVSFIPAPPTVPGVPQNLVAAAGDEQVALTWDPPASDGESPILDYALRYRTGGGDWTVVNPAASGVIVSGLNNGTEYEFQVRARNAVGYGAWTASVFATPMTVPSVPLNLAATAPDVGQQVALTWDLPADDGGSAIIDYALHYRTGGGAWTLVDPEASGVVISGLDNGTEYEFQVRARNIVGDSAWTASVFATPATFPGIPQNLAADPGDQQATLTWDPPADDGGAAIIDYAISYRVSGGSWSVPATAASGVVVSGLDNGTSYDFRVRDRNSVGVGTWSAPVSTTPRTVPDAPTGLAATPGNTQVALTWAAPAFNGGAAITDYVVQYRTGGGGWLTFPDGTSTNLFATVTGLINGTDYEFQVLAHNPAGDGAPSTSVFATPRTVPGMPTGLLITFQGDEEIGLSWAAPASNGGAAIFDYEVEWCAGTLTFCTTGGGIWGTFPDATSTATTTTVTGLTNGTLYQFQVRAENVAGLGEAGPSVAGKPRTVPGAPTGLSPAPGNTQVALTWSAPAFDGGMPVDDYVVQYRTGGGSWLTFPDGGSTNLFATVTGLINGTSYEFQVLAHNVAGNGNPSAGVFSTPATTPGVPQGLVAAPGNTQVILTFAAPASNGGSAITDYQVQYKQSSSGTWLAYNDGTPSAATGRTVTGLTNGTSYDFQVLAVNAVGAGSWTATVSAAPAGGATVPGVPRNLTPTAGNGQVALAWLEPSSNGGSAITDYVVQYRYCATPGGGGSCSTWGDWTTFPDTVTSTTGATVTGLWNGDLYGFRVAAVNAIGQGDWTAVLQSTPVCASGCPGVVPGLDEDSDGVDRIRLDWNLPSGSGISDYQVRYRLDNTAVWTVFNDGTSTNRYMTVAGLVSGTVYEFQVRARNATGWGVWSSTVHESTDPD